MAVPLAAAGVLAVLSSLIALAFPAVRRAAFWFAVASIGQGAALSMIIAGPATRYQHYAPLGTLVREHPLLLGIVAAQAVLVAAAWLQRIRGGALRGMPGWRVAAALCLSMATAATVSPALGRYLSELAFAATVQLLAVATVGLMALAWPGTRVGPSVPAPDPRSRLDATTWAAAGVAIVLAATLNVFSYERYPHVPDEVAYLHHAKYLAAGVLELPAPAVPPAFDVDLLEYEPTRWYSPVPPGWPFALAAGAWAGVPWLVNPVLAGLNVLLTRILLSHLYSWRIARASAILLALSPWFLFLGMSFMPHQLTLFCALVAAVGVATARDTGKWWWGLIGGAGVGAVSLIRPLDGVIVGGLIAVWSIGVGGARLKVPALAAVAAGTLVVGAIALPYNRMLTGDPLTFPINAYVNKHYAPNANAYGFGPDRGMGWATDPNPGHTPLDGVINANLNTFGINTDLFGWVTGSLVFVAWLVCSAGWRRPDSVLMAVVIAFGLAYFPYYFSGGPDFGARYWFPAIVPLVALSARGIDAMSLATHGRAWIAVGALSVMSLAIYVPWRAVDKYHHYRGIRADVRTLAAQQGFGADLILVRGRRFPDYAAAFVENPVDLQGRAAVYAWDRDAETRAAVLQAYPDRRVWLVDGPSVTGGGFRIAAGPLAAASVSGSR